MTKRPPPPAPVLRGPSEFQIADCGLRIFQFAFCNFKFAIAYNESMHRTFSIARLMLGFGAVFVLCGLSIRFPEYGSLVALFVPPAIVSLILVSLSPHKAIVLIGSFVGALVGYLFSPVDFLGPRGDPTTFWSHFEPLITPISVWSTGGAFVFGGATLIGAWLDSRHRPIEQPSSHSSLQ
jgi:hypothetical protein